MPAPLGFTSGGSSEAMASGPVRHRGAGVQPSLGPARVIAFVLDSDRRIAAWSAAAEELTGRPADAALGSDVAVLFPEDAHAQVGDVFGPARGSGEFERAGLLPVRRADGCVFDAAFNVTALRRSHGSDLLQVVAVAAADLPQSGFGRTAQQASPVDRIRIGVACLDADGCSAPASGALATHSRIQAEHLQGRGTEEVFPSTDPGVSHEHRSARAPMRLFPPDRMGAVDCVRVGLRHRPGPGGAPFCGDWFDVIALPCHRIAVLIGDVKHGGPHTAEITGQFRAAARTLARLDLSPAAILRELDELARSMGEDHIATCVHAVYDPVDGECVAASAGHPPPLLITQGGGVEPLDVSPGAPLGAGGRHFDEHAFTVEPSSALALYTDGLVEDRVRHIALGLDDLLGAISKAASSGQGPWLEAVCDAAFEAMPGLDRADDATLLVVGLDRFPEDHIASWVLASQPTVAARARELVRRRLDDWCAQSAAVDAADDPSAHLGDVADVVELLVSELVTNALRYGRGPIGLRLLRGGPAIVCEVSDELGAAPRLRTVHHGDEGGRGLHLVDQLSARWGARTTTRGKTVWFEV
jgi:PAS domain S-box-containing protein